MQYHWLNKQNNTKLIVFFAGWSFDYKPFEFLKCEDYDVLITYDYNEISEFIEFPHYDNKFLIAWSMGVFTAYKLKKYFIYFDKKVAINGTPFPVDDEFGIPIKPFLLTLKHAKVGLEGKFYQNIFNSIQEFEKYSNNQVERSVENRVLELNELYKRINSTSREYERFYDIALISKNDKIVPTKNQINFWKNYNTPYKTIDSGHFLFYNYVSWKELL